VYGQVCFNPDDSIGRLLHKRPYPTAGDHLDDFIGNLHGRRGLFSHRRSIPAAKPIGSRNHRANTYNEHEFFHGRLFIAEGKISSIQSLEFSGFPEDNRNPDILCQYAMN
jgi:hypothetical protein